MNNEKWIVLGSGFRGIIGAYLLSGKGHEVTMIDKASKIGGVLFSEEWKGCYLDKGCHLFDNDSDELTSSVMDIMNEEVLLVRVKYASIINDRLTDEIAIPDLGSFGEKIAKNILFETIECASRPSASSSNLFEMIQQRHGTTAGNILKDVIIKMYCLEPEKIDVGAFNLMPFQRIKFLNDRLGNILKESKTLDLKLAVASQNDPMRFYKENARKYPFRNFYPRQHGLRGFCEKALLTLSGKNVCMMMNTTIKNIAITNHKITITYDDGKIISADKLLWAVSQELLGSMFGIENNLKDYIHSVPMVLHYFTVNQDDVSDYSYIQNFSKDDLFFRASIPTNYGRDNAPKNMAYICCELPTPLGSANWDNPEQLTHQVWEELRKYNIVKGDKYIDHLVFKTPVSYQVPKVGYYDELEKILSKIPADKIHGAGSWQFSKNSIVKDVTETLSTY